VVVVVLLLLVVLQLLVLLLGTLGNTLMLVSGGNCVRLAKGFVSSTLGRNCCAAFISRGVAAANTGGVNVKPLSSALVRILGSTLGCNNVDDVDDSTLCGAHTMMDDSKRLAASACSLMAITGTVCGGVGCVGGGGGVASKRDILAAAAAA